MSLFRKTKSDAGITETLFECQRDELTIRGTEYRPQGENLPVAIVCHGFMAFQDTVRQYAKCLARLGYAAYCFDFCGGSVVKGKSDGKTTDMSVLTETRDLEAVIDYVQSLPYTGSELLLMGCSQGGFVSALTAAKRKERVTKLVLFYPALCIPDDARAGSMMFARFAPDDIPKTIRCGPMLLGRCYVADVIDMDPYEEIAPYPGPVLLVHGSKDKIVKPDYSRRALEVYGSDRAELKIIDGGAHGFSGRHDKLAMEELARFAKL